MLHSTSADVSRLAGVEAVGVGALMCPVCQGSGAGVRSMSEILLSALVMQHLYRCTGFNQYSLQCLRTIIIPIVYWAVKWIAQAPILFFCTYTIQYACVSLRHGGSVKHPNHTVLQLLHPPQSLRAWPTVYQGLAPPLFWDSMWGEPHDIGDTDVPKSPLHYDPLSVCQSQVTDGEWGRITNPCPPWCFPAAIAFSRS